MAERPVRRTAIAYADFVLKNGVSVSKGELICFDSSVSAAVTKGETSTTLKPIGYATESLTGDGVKKINVRIFGERWVEHWDNDGTNPVLASDLYKLAYIKDARTVSISSGTGTRSIAGRIWFIDDRGKVAVEML